jgi:hypothetical protein
VHYGEIYCPFFRLKTLNKFCSICFSTFSRQYADNQAFASICLAFAAWKPTNGVGAVDDAPVIFASTFYAQKSQFSLPCIKIASANFIERQGI